MVRSSSALLHLCAISAMSYGYTALHGLAVNSWITSQYGGHFQFLTIQGLAVAWLTMGGRRSGRGFLSFDKRCVKRVCAGPPNCKPKGLICGATGIRATKRALLIAAMPIATIVSSIYWTLLLTFPHLILRAMPEESAPIGIPLRIDLALHAAPCIALLADFMIFERRYGTTVIKYVAPAITLVCTLWYGWWVEHCASKNGTFAYPFLTLNPMEIRLRIYAGAGTLACLSFYALNALHPKSR